MVPARGIEPRVHPYHGCVLPLYYAGALLFWHQNTKKARVLFTIMRKH